MKEHGLVRDINLMNYFVSPGDIRPTCDAFGASFRGSRPKRGNNAKPAANLQPTQSRR